MVEVSGSEAKGMKLSLGFDQCNWTLKDVLREKFEMRMLELGFDQCNWTLRDVLRGKFEMRMLESHLWSEKKHCWSFLVVDTRIISL